jgi:IS605 OrfB family transposase
MRLTASVQLTTTPEQSATLLQTLERANAACNALSEWAWQQQTFGQYVLHRARYAALRSEFNLTAQVVVRCISKVADAYKLDKAAQREFRAHGSIAYDDRILRWYVDRRTVSIWTVAGRLTLSFSCGEPQRELLRFQQGESDLVYQDGQWYLLATCHVEDPPPADVKGVLGNDLGIANIATDSQGKHYSGEAVRSVRKRLKRLRSGLQKCASRSAKKHLRRVRRKQSRFVRWVNHNISKAIVQTALASSKAIGLEMLTGIRDRVSASKERRWLLGHWAFDQLQQFVCYKARRAGIPVLFVDPAYTSQTCSCCGHCERANRPKQSQFHCQQCGFEMNADLNAARNIEARAALVTRPMVPALA